MNSSGLQRRVVDRLTYNGNSQQSPHEEALLEALDVERAVLPPLLKLVIHLEPTNFVFPPHTRDSGGCFSRVLE